MRSRKIRLFNAVAALLFAISACTSAPQEKLDIPSGALKKQSKYAVLWIKPCVETLLGRCEPDDGRTTEAKLAIHGAADKIDLKKQYEEEVVLSASIAHVNAAPTIERYFLRDFKNSLSSKGFDVVALAQPVYEGLLTNLDSKTVSFADQPRLSAQQFPLQVKSNTFDFKPLYEKLGVDFLLVLELLTFNVERHYGPAGKPTSNPQVVTALRVYIHERASNEILFNDFAYDFALTDDGWEQPPYYQSVADLLVTSLRKSLGKTKANLLEKNF